MLRRLSLAPGTVPLLFLLSWMVVSAPASAQPTPAAAAEETAEETSAVEEASPSGAPETAGVGDAPAALRTPRASLRTFLEAMADGDFDAAMRCVDLSETGLSPRLLGIRGPEIAAGIKAALDKVVLVDFDEIPDDPGGPPLTLYRRDGALLEMDRGEDGGWRFTAETVERLPRTTEQLGDRDTIEGVVEVPETRSQWLRSKMPESLHGTAFLLEHWQWLGLGLLVLMGVVVDLLSRYVLFVLLARRLSRYVTRESGTIQRSLRPLGLVAMGAVWWFGLGWLGLPDQVLSVLGVAVELVAIVGVIWAAYRWVDIASGKLRQRAELTDSRLDDMLVPLFERTLKILIVVFGLIFLADSLQIPLTSLLAGVSIGGIAIALAAQDLLRNLFGSVTVLLDRPFEVGDWVKIDDIEGTVTEVAFRSTRVRTFYDSVITLPNANLIDAAVDNLGRRRYRRWSTKIGLAYDTPPERIEAFCEAVRQAVLEQEHTRKDYFFVELNGFGASSLEVLLYVFFEAAGWDVELRARHQLALRVLEVAKELDVEIAFPTQTLHLRAGEGDLEALVRQST